MPNWADDTYYLYSHLDPLDAVAELDDANNYSPTATMGGEPVGAWIEVRLSATLGAPELYVWRLEPDDEGNWFAPASPTNYMSYELEVRNGSLGVDFAGPCDVDFYLSPNDDTSDLAGDTFVSTETLGAVTGGAVARMRGDLELPAGFTPVYGAFYYLKAVIDPADAVAEMDETNNRAAGGPTYFRKSGFPPPRINIDPDWIDGVAVAAMEVNEPYHIAPRLYADGDTATGRFTLAVFISPDATIDGSSTGDDIMIASHEFDRPGLPGVDGYWCEYLECVIPSGTSPGTYYVGYIADYVMDDPEGRVEEYDEWLNPAEDNTFVQAEPVTAYGDGLGGPDLLTLLTGGPNPAIDYYVEAGAIGVEVPNLFVANFGTRSVAAGVVVDFYLSGDQVVDGADDQVGTHTCDALDSGRYYVLTENRPTFDFTSISTGTYYGYSIIDPTDAVPGELDETHNNSTDVLVNGMQAGRWTVFEVQASVTAPELYITRVNSDDTTYWGAGTEVVVDFEAANACLTVASAACQADVYISTNNDTGDLTGDVLLTKMAIQALAPGGFVEFEESVALPGGFTPTLGIDYYYKVVIDALGDVSEIREDNNISASAAFQFTP